MNKKVSKSLTNLGLILSMLLLFCININSNGQEKIVLKPEELPGFKLIKESKWSWFIGSEEYNAIYQDWHLSDAQYIQELVIIYGEFPTIPLAIFGASYQAHTQVSGFTWGSLTDYIIGEETWFSQYTPDAQNSKSIYFTKANIAIQIFTGSYPNRDFTQLFKTVSEKIIEKINIYDTAFINSAISDSVVRTYGESTWFLNSLIPSFTEHNEQLSVWIIDSTTYSFGVRNEYEVDSATIGVDLCVFNSESDATRSEGIQADICSISGKVFDMNDSDLSEKFQSEWDYYLNSVSAENTFSMILAGGKTLVHLYGFNMKPAHFDQMNALLNEITFAVLKNSWRVEIPQESYLLEQNRPNPFSQSTIIEYCIPHGSENSSIYLYDRQGKKQKIYPLPPGGRSELFIDSSNLQSGIYFYSLIIDGQAKGTKQMVRVN